MRSTGIDVLGKIPWGTHLCQFYKTPQDLVEILVPYFREGLESNEFCMWITSEPLLRDQARKALAAEVPDLEERISKGQIEILDYRDWYTSTGAFDADRVLRGWVAKHDGAIAKGFEGLRLTGNTFWLEMSDWNKFSDYEERINDVIGQYKILALCTYCLDRCGAPEVIDVVNHHQSTLVKNEARWILIESKQQKQLGLALQEHGHRLRFALEAAQLGEWDLDLATHAARRSLRHDQIFGYDRLLPEWTYDMFLEHVLPEDRPLVEEGFRKAMDTGQNWEFECRITRRDGVRRWIWAKGGVSFDSAGRPSRLRGVVQDITDRKQAEQALRESERQHRELAKALEVEHGKLAAIIECLSVGVVIADGTGTILSMNAAALGFHDLRSMGEAHSKMEGFARDFETRYPDGRIVPVNEWPLARALRGEYVRDFEMQVRNMAVGRAWAGSYSVVPVQDDAGGVLFFVTAIQDVTKIRRAEEQVRSMALFPQQNPSPVMRVGKNGTILHSNPSGEEMLKHLGWAKGRPAPVGFEEALRRTRERGDREFELSLPDGRTLSFVIAPIAQADYINLYGRDITRMKHAEESLRRSRDELESRVKERTVELSRTIDLLRGEVARRTLAEQGLRERSDQLRTLASELTLAEQRERRKLAQVLHDSLQQLLVGVKYRLKVLQRTKGKDLQNTAVEMEGLVSKSIDVSRLLTFELSPPILYDGGLVQGLEWLASWMKDKYGLKVDLKAREAAVPRQEAVTLLLFQATRELLFNTLKHSGVKAARILVSCRNDWIEIQVSDQGKGFRPDRALEGRSVSGGFGLFSIQERLALMGGRLEIESSPGQGCRIVLAAPLGRNPEDGESALRSPGESPSPQKKVLTGNPAGGLERIRVILADDHAVVRKGLAQLLKNEPDIDVVSEASDGPSAVRLARELRPDVVVMDIGMPGMDGIEATKVLHKELPGVRVIGLSIYEENERGEAMRQAGAAAYLTKSGPPEDVIEAIRSCVRPARKSKSVALMRGGIRIKRTGRRRLK